MLGFGKYRSFFSSTNFKRKTSCLDRSDMLSSRIKRNFAILPLNYNQISSKKMKKPEITIYIKGFLSEGEHPDHFELWLNSHNSLSKTHEWGNNAAGFYWDCGTVSNIPVASLAHTAWHVIKRGRMAFTKFNPYVIPVIAIHEGLVFAGRIIHQYQYASKQLPVESIRLREHIRTLMQTHEKVRIVAHSLGCQLLVRSVSSLPLHERPHEIHLCGPAFQEGHFRTHLSDLAQDACFLYYCTRDWILGTYSFLHGDHAIGYSGPTRKYSKLFPKNVDPYFSLFVHFNYKHHFTPLLKKQIFNLQKVNHWYLDSQLKVSKKREM